MERKAERKLERNAKRKPERKWNANGTQMGTQVERILTGLFFYFLKFQIFSFCIFSFFVSFSLLFLFPVCHFKCPCVVMRVESAFQRKLFVVAYFISIPYTHTVV